MSGGPSLHLRCPQMTWTAGKRLKDHTKSDIMLHFFIGLTVNMDY